MPLPAMRSRPRWPGRRTWADQYCPGRKRYPPGERKREGSLSAPPGDTASAGTSLILEDPRSSICIGGSAGSGAGKGGGSKSGEPVTCKDIRSGTAKPGQGRANGKPRETGGAYTEKTEATHASGQTEAVLRLLQTASLPGGMPEKLRAAKRRGKGAGRERSPGTDRIHITKQTRTECTGPGRGEEGRFFGGACMPEGRRVPSGRGKGERTIPAEGAGRCGPPR